MKNGQEEKITGVRFKRSGLVSYFECNGLTLIVGDKVSVDTECGPREGQVIVAPGQVAYSELEGPLRAVLRKI